MMQHESSVRQACQQVAPLWPLANFVAVNPYLGFSDKSFAGTAHYFRRVEDARMTLPLEWYAGKFKERAITREDLGAAIERAPGQVREAFAEADADLSVSELIRALDNPAQPRDPFFHPVPFSAYYDEREGTHWQAALREEAAKWCAAYYDRGQASFRLSGREEGFYIAWLQAVKHDRNLSCMGLRRAHKVLAAMPESPGQAIAEAVEVMGIPGKWLSEWLYRVFMTLPGWAGHLRYLDREAALAGREGEQLRELLAVLLNYERLLHGRFCADEDCLLGWQRLFMEEPIGAGDRSLPIDLARELVWQGAYEHSVEARLREAIQPNPAGHKPERPQIQAAFCIDVRSELLRRNLEAVMPGTRTIGFAGFFGVPLRHLPFGQLREQSRCPALLAPPLASCEKGHSHGPDCTDGHQREKRAWKQFKESAASCFTFVETLGLGYGWTLLKSALGAGGDGVSGRARPSLVDGLDLRTRTEIAASIIRGLSLTRQCAPLVLLCGHGSSTRNNPYASGLDCGACGGHPGDANARIAATLLNDPQVRKGLASSGLMIPADTVFIAGLHCTTTDEVTLYDPQEVPDSHQKLLEALRQGLAEAGALSASRRAASMGQPGPDALAAVRARSRDWSQVRPEWGLAGNAGFLIAPRDWTCRSRLDGRAFLHEYDPSTDPEGFLLEAIMAGPLVVGSWINLQYFASSIDNEHFGSGHKSIHNVVGGLGVALGNAYDLRPGLPLQSVHDGRKLVHEPSRLHAMVAAEPEVIDAILNRQTDLAELVANEWIHLFAMGADGSMFLRRQPDGSWEDCPANERALDTITG